MAQSSRPKTASSTAKKSRPWKSTGRLSTNESDLFRYCGGGSVERVTDQFADLSSVDSRPVLFQGRLFFAVDDDVFGRELWALDPMTALFCDGFADGDDDDWSSSLP